MNPPRARSLRRTALVLAAGACLVGGACRTTRVEPPQAAAPAMSDVARLAAWMTGSFSSAAQSAEQPDLFFDIRLTMVPIWTERDDGPWLYVEQAAASALERPYRQRVYRLVGTDAGVRSDVYMLPGDPLEFAGAWRTPEEFEGLGPDALFEREGCSIHLITRRDGTFEGSTEGSACGSTLGGAAYATSEVVITPDLLTSWDRGFDEAGRQVWGATAGPYAFVKEREPADG